MSLASKIREFFRNEIDEEFEIKVNQIVKEFHNEKEASVRGTITAFVKRGELVKTGHGYVKIGKLIPKSETRLTRSQKRAIKGAGAKKFVQHQMDPELGKNQGLIHPPVSVATKQTSVRDRLYGVPMHRVLSLLDLEQHQGAHKEINKMIQSGHLMYVGKGYVKVMKTLAEGMAQSGFDRMYSGEFPNTEKLAKDFQK